MNQIGRGIASLGLFGFLSATMYHGIPGVWEGITCGIFLIVGLALLWGKTP